MSIFDESLKKVNDYALVARNAQIVLTMEPPNPREHPEAEEARGLIAQNVFNFLTEVLDGVKSPYFVASTPQDTQYINHLAADGLSQLVWDRRGVFDLSSEPKIHRPDAGKAQAASFAYLASSCMRQVRTPFLPAPSLRTELRGVQDLADFVQTVNSVKDTTLFACESESYHNVVQKCEWRTAYAFWEANRWLAGTLNPGLDQAIPTRLN